jgi:hypothetical protein
MCAHAVTVNDVLDGHVALDIRSLDRIYLNAYVPILQTSAQDAKKPATKDAPMSSCVRGGLVEAPGVGIQGAVDDVG